MRALSTVAGTNPGTNTRSNTRSNTCARRVRAWVVWLYLMRISVQWGRIPRSGGRPPAIIATDVEPAALERYLAAKAADEADSLFTVTKIQTRFYRADGSAVNHDPKVLLRTQDLEPWFEENSNLYIFSAASFAFVASLKIDE